LLKLWKAAFPPVVVLAGAMAGTLFRQVALWRGMSDQAKSKKGEDFYKEA
jgi:hypothetical protein